MGKLLSVVIPSYNEEAMIDAAAETIHSVLEKEAIPHELIFVDDGSKDKTWENISRASSEHTCVRGVRFSRNFGKEAAINAGLCAAIGECCAVIDCDLQHPPAKLVEMYRLWEQGYQVIEGQKSDRGKESFLHKLAAGTFYKLISNAAGFDMSRASDFKLLDRKAVDALLTLKERNAFFRALSSWIGFKSTAVTFEVQERTTGKSKWSTRSLIKYAIGNITSFSTAPMQLVTALGVLMLIISLILGTVTLVEKFMGYAAEGFTTVILIQLFIGSITMISIGIIGYYIAKIYDEIKNRPKYFVSDNCGECGESEDERQN